MSGFTKISTAIVAVFISCFLLFTCLVYFHIQNNIEEEVLAMAQLLGLEHRLDFYPTTLSGGEKQRVAIGRAFIARPHIILADEPTGNLDTETGERISNELIEMAHKLNQNLIIVTHDDELAAKCDKTYVLANKAIS